MTRPAHEKTEPAFEFPSGLLEALSFAAVRRGLQLRKESGVSYITPSTWPPSGALRD